jgi:hypothetical protein
MGKLIDMLKHDPKCPFENEGGKFGHTAMELEGLCEYCLLFQRCVYRNEQLVLNQRNLINRQRMIDPNKK